MIILGVPSSIKDDFTVVPPISKVITLSSLQYFFNKIAAPITPATGPLSTQKIGVS